MNQELRLRIQSGIVMAIVVLLATWLGGFAFRLMAVAISLLVFYEWSTMTRLREENAAGFAFGWFSQFILAIAILLGFMETAAALLLAFVLLSTVYTSSRKLSWWLAGGIVYAGLTGLSLSAIRGSETGGLKAMLIIFAVVWGTDILAYFVGRAMGGPKLAPSISPGKTWSGAIGGTLAAIIFGSVAVHWAGGSINVGLILLLLVLSALSQIGDLFESYIKRRFGVKDSGKLIPGHGGVMDRVDGLVFACFTAFLLSATAAVFSSCTQCSVGTMLFGLVPN